MAISIQASGQACGAEVRGVDLSQPLDDETVAAIKAAWAEHLVLSFPGQDMSDGDLERFTTYFGALSEEPYFRPIEGQRYIAAIVRRADETTPIFAESWHSDWSFKDAPPLGTCLYGKIIPPAGGDTLFANQQMAFAQLPPEKQLELEAVKVVHSAAPAYAPDGLYGKEDDSAGRSMKPIVSEDARATQIHYLVRLNPDSGQKAIYGCMGYTIGVDGMDDEQGLAFLQELHAWQTRPEFVYTHKWQPGMLVMWDNRSVLHRATGGYDGYDRLLHRTTVWDKHAA